MGAGTRVASEREALGWSQQKLATAVTRLGYKISQTGIDKIEKRDTLRPKCLKELSIALNVNEDWLLKGREPKERLSEPAATKFIDVPIVAPVSAGVLMSPGVTDEKIGTVSLGGLDPRGDWIAMKVEGDSMDRISPPGSVILINRKERRLVPNGCFVVSDGEDGVTYKRFRPSPDRLEPVSTNPSHEPVFYENEPTVIGRVRKTILDM